MITTSQSRELIAHLSDKYDTTVVYPDDAVRVVAQGLIDAIAHVEPIFRTLADQLAVRTSRTSVTLPSPIGCLVVLSPAAASNPLQLAITGSHEHQHAKREKETGAGQTIVDYAEAELRAQREAEAYAVSLAVEWFLTGVIPTLDRAMESLGSETYILPAEHVKLARGILEQALVAMESGVCPPISVALDVLTWLRAKHPELLLAKVA